MSQSPAPNDALSPFPTTAALLYSDEPVEADNKDGSLSDYFSDGKSDTTSITPSVRDYVYENGRRYHRYGGEGKYVLPNDETEQDRLDLMHHIQLMALGGELYMAPVKNAQNVLDCGTGTGIWALDFGDSHPESKVTGVDLSPIQPGWTAPNVAFEVDDLEKDWSWEADHFDFIHIRSICNGYFPHNPQLSAPRRTSLPVPPHFSNLIVILDTDPLTIPIHAKPGGWTELSELSFELIAKDNTIPADSALAQYLDCVKRGYAEMGIAFPNARMLKQSMEKAGFVDIVARTVSISSALATLIVLIPCGPWPRNRRLKKLGATVTLVDPAGFEAYGLAPMTRALGMDIEEAKKVCHKAHADLLNPAIHASLPVYYVFGCKPEAG
ncbi:S-adenosyl-L-methionine-dependent methyltransferase [Ascodesmis nigricans]|uniref:S-adenosyl-L-methionine-dependent methyltransferase n=1 Tax=Ascodesmis nigricans TaxID=341454 RepID=A0A4S2MRD0_9PEZI|nr:S-adenosyl-L-methionine-dependent methyltransferase [Ascodesmis nigricans]